MEEKLWVENEQINNDDNCVIDKTREFDGWVQVNKHCMLKESANEIQNCHKLLRKILKNHK